MTAQNYFVKTESVVIQDGYGPYGISGCWSGFSWVLYCLYFMSLQPAFVTKVYSFLGVLA